MCVFMLCCGVCVHTCVCVLCIHVCVYMYVCNFMLSSVCVCMHVCMCVCVCVWWAQMCAVTESITSFYEHNKPSVKNHCLTTHIYADTYMYNLNQLKCLRVCVCLLCQCVCGCVCMCMCVHIVLMCL